MQYIAENTPTASPDTRESWLHKIVLEENNTGISRLIKFAENRTCTYKVKVDDGKSSEEFKDDIFLYDSDDYDYYNGGIRDICDYDSDTGICEY